MKLFRSVFEGVQHDEVNNFIATFERFKCDIQDAVIKTIS